MTPARRVTVSVQTAVEAAEVAKLQLPTAAVVRQWARAALSHHGRGGEVTVRIVGAGEGAALNRRYRHKAGPTNVLSFPYGPPEETMTPLLGDIVICAPVVLAEARAQDKPVDAHWAHMVVHGVLHLLGYDHETEREARDMEALEAALLRRLGYPDPYGESARSA